MKFREPVYLVVIAFLMGWIFTDSQENQVNEQTISEVDKTLPVNRMSEHSSEAVNPLQDIEQLIIHSDAIVKEVEVAMTQDNTSSTIESFDSLEREVFSLSELPLSTVESDFPVVSSSEDESTLSYQMEDDLTYLIASLSELDMELQEVLQPRSDEKISEYIIRVDETIGIEKFEELTDKLIKDMNPDIN